MCVTAPDTTRTDALFTVEGSRRRSKRATNGPTRGTSRASSSGELVLTRGAGNETEPSPSSQPSSSVVANAATTATGRTKLARASALTVGDELLANHIFRH